MFVKETAFLLGAGASWHYGYPTGEQLVDAVAARAERLRSMFIDLQQNARHLIPDLIRGNNPAEEYNARTGSPLWDKGIASCDRMMQRLADARPLVIDYFLGLNDDIEDIGRFLIAWVVLECEHKNEDRPRWYRYLIHQLVTGCSQSSDLLKNRVRFFTFNYDTSLDRALRGGLLAHSLFKREDVDRFLSNRVVHLYGQADEPDKISPVLDFKVMRLGNHERREACVRLLNTIYAASKGIKVIDPKDKQNEAVFDGAHSMIHKAQVVYILGYGFDESNSKRLRLHEALKVTPKAVLFTNYKDANRINKKASKVLFGVPDVFLSRSIFKEAGRYFEKSTRNVYEALSLDFDSIEEL